MCGGLSKNDPHRLMCLNIWPIGNSTIRKCGLVRVGVALLEEICYCGVELGGLTCSSKA